MRCSRSLFTLGSGLALLLVRSSTLAAEPAARADPDPDGVAAFSHHAKFREVKISPKGTYLAALAVNDGKRSLAVIDLATRKIASNVVPGGETMIGKFYWANDERVVAELIDKDAEVDFPVSRGEIYSFDAKTGSGRLIFGYRAGEMQTGSHVRKGGADLAWGHVVDTLPDDDRRILVAARTWDAVGDRTVWLTKVDVYTGLQTRVTAKAIREGWFVTDEKGEPRIAGEPQETSVTPRWWVRPAEEWVELSTLKGVRPGSEPVAYAASARTLYTIEAEPGGGFALVGVGIADGSRKVLARNDLVPPETVLTDPETGAVVLAEFQPDLPTYEIVDARHPFSRVLEALLAAYPDEQVRLVSATKDDSKLVALVYGDRDPGQYLLVDSATMSAEPIIQARPWIRPADMAEMRAFHIAASDGMRIHGYVTLPRGGTPGVAPPLVVLPHGGPHGIRDGWGFHPEVQLLAKQGFAVLQVNYRGSGGYGDAYGEAGYRHWGDRVVEDIVDATRFAIRKGYADPKRICIYGSSFGAYAALQATIVAPDLFRCAAGNAGVYDLTRMDHSDFAEHSRLGSGYLRSVLGGDAAALRAASPAHNAGRIKARVLLVHGKEDRRAPIEHAERLREALEKAGNPPQWLVEPKEGHGFSDEGARERMYTRLVQFLRENTTPAQGGAAPPAASGAAR